MLKKFLFASLLALQLTAIMDRAVAEVPLPDCLPCDNVIDPPAR